MKVSKKTKKSKKQRKAKITQNVIVQEFSDIVLAGPANIRLTGDGTIQSDSPFKCKVANKVLTITGSYNTSNTSFRIGNNTFHNHGSFIGQQGNGNIMFSSGGSQVSIGDGNSQTMNIVRGGGNKFYNHGSFVGQQGDNMTFNNHRGSTVRNQGINIIRNQDINVVNGKIVSVTTRNGTFTGAEKIPLKKEDGACKSWRILLKPTGDVKYTVKSAGSLTIEDVWWMPSDCKSLHFTANGMGRIIITSHSWAVVPVFVLAKSMGRVTGIRAGKSIEATAKSMGRIGGMTARDCKVRERVSGMGRIDLK